MRLLIISLALLLLAGCVSTSDKSESIVKIGKDTYQISGTTYNYYWSKDEVLISANKHCSQQGKELLLTSKESNSFSEDSMYNTLTFLCLKDDDPRYTEANPQIKADITIEKKSTK